jgi:hypothetical protein
MFIPVIASGVAIDRPGIKQWADDAIGTETHLPYAAMMCSSAKPVRLGNLRDDNVLGLCVYQYGYKAGEYRCFLGWLVSRIHM